MPVSSQPISVSQLNREARQLLEQGFGMLEVEGEISNFACPSSGHWYFTLKDSLAQVRCALFRNRNRFLKYRPQNGDQVRLRAKVSLYEGRGEFQLIGDYLEEAGAGALQAAFEQLKTKLQNEGLFDPAHKRPLPKLPQHLGVITSPTGAALRDVLSVLRRRFPALPVTLYPSAVQGEEAPAQLIRALALANRDRRCDVLIFTRGGGSLEDLWPFNDEGVARAVHASKIPVVSAVGHEVDFGISDFVADLRAPTPSAAAELVSPDASHWLQQFQALEARLLGRWQQQARLRHQQLRGLRQRLRHPGQRLQEQAQRLDNLELRLKRLARQQQNQQRQRLSQLQARLLRCLPVGRVQQLQARRRELEERLQASQVHRLERLRLRLAAQAQALNAVSPLATLDRGYAIVRDAEGNVVRDCEQVAPGDQITARLARGSLACRVTTCQPLSKEPNP
ncbi:exodeoxyribonuclease VII large subunit [Motiliproteus sp. SC1-56]|uniref:exodeoxyribonuclease VII large subunit n=1 Tax=Motiliproteus sp. SC1-56 TaxID=2799565 RepID=UPI001A8DE867